MSNAHDASASADEPTDRRSAALETLHTANETMWDHEAEDPKGAALRGIGKYLEALTHAVLYVGDQLTEKNRADR